MAANVTRRSRPASEAARLRELEGEITRLRAEVSKLREALRIASDRERASLGSFQEQIRLFTTPDTLND